VHTLRAESFEFDAGDCKVTVLANDVPVIKCIQCGEEYAGPDALRIRHDAVCEALGYLPPAEYKRIREQNNWSQQYLADLTGYGVATVSRAERGRQLPNRNYDITLRAIRDSIEYRNELMRQFHRRSTTNNPVSSTCDPVQLSSV